jgi:gliding-associated putative ABC transporter substrate-binding component GldG
MGVDRIKKYNIIDFLLIILIIILLNVISYQYFFRLDLTEEKRYTISEDSKIILQNLSDPVYVEIYLDGDLPSGFKRLQRSVKETLEEFRIYANTNIQYKFIDVTSEKDEGVKRKKYIQLAEKGLQPTNIYANENGKQTEKLIFPGAIISYRNKELPILFLKGTSAAGAQEALNQAVEGVEFEIVSSIKKLSSNKRKRIGILDGHYELSNIELNDIYLTLKDNYDVNRINLLEDKSVLQNIDLLIVAKPKKSFSENEKLLIDQYLVRGGKALFLIDKVKVEMDSLIEGRYLATPYPINLDDLLFKMGIRINNTVCEDLQSGAIPMVIGMMGNQPQTQLVPWKYYPVLGKFSSHATVKNLSLCLSKFVGSIDTVKAMGMRKTPLVFTSPYTKETNAPFEISLREAQKQPDPSEYNRGSMPVGYLLEGKYKSLYTNRLTEQQEKDIDFKSVLSECKIIVFSDGDLIKNEVSADKSQVYPLGFDRYMRKNFSNKQLIQNCIDYLSDSESLIKLRLKEVKLRLLDKQKIKKEKVKWQIINIVMPILLIFIIGIVKYYHRKSKFGK